MMRLVERPLGAFLLIVDTRRIGHTGGRKAAVGGEPPSHRKVLFACCLVHFSQVSAALHSICLPT